MPWNQPGSGGEKDPWGQNRGGQRPPDLDEIVRTVQNKLGGLFGSKRGSNGPGNGSGSGSWGLQLPRKSLVIVLLVIGVLVWLGTGVYEVEQSERAVILRLGKYLETQGPGLNWNFPQPIEQRFIINVQKENVVEVGYRSQQTSSETKRNLPREALMLTADENIIDIQFAVHYDLKDPRDRLFFVSEPTDVVVRQATESAVREVVGRSTMDFVITGGRANVTAEVHELLQHILDRYQSGINIRQVKMQDAQPPAEVKPAFDDAVKAREDEERIKNEAEAYSNDVIPRARGGAARILQEAEAYKASVIARSTGEASRFAQILAEYRKAPEVTRDRLYIETMESVLSNSSKLMIDQKGGGNVIYLPLDQLLRERRDASTLSRSGTDFASDGTSEGIGSDRTRNRTSGRTGRGQ